jgi:flagellar protein FlgJ
MAGLDISGLNASALTEYAAGERKNAAANALKSKLENVSGKTSDDELWTACKSFEAYFLEQMFK